MTWNPRDVAIPAGIQNREDGSGFQMPERPNRSSPRDTGTPYLPKATPTIAEAMEWQSRSDDLGPAMPPDLVQELALEGIFSARSWDRWRNVLLRGHYE